MTSVVCLHIAYVKKVCKASITRHFCSALNSKLFSFNDFRQFSLTSRRLKTMASITVEATVAKDMKNGEMREVEIGDGKVLLIKENDKFSAIGNKCTHYGAPLVKGILANGQVRCPWHGACFNSKTGDIEDFPGLDSLQAFTVKKENDKVFISAEPSRLVCHKRVKTSKVTITNLDNAVIIGGGAAAVTCAEALRQNEYSGKITMITLDRNLPYDRPKLSKAMDVSAQSIQLRNEDFYKENGIDILLGKEVISLNSESKTVTLEDGNNISYNKLLLATGGKPRTLPIPGWDLKNVYILRTPEDANKIATKAQGKKVLVIGASFIGMEVASFLVSKASSLTVCEYFSTPFERVLGVEVGKMIQKMHEDKGVKFCMNASVTELQGENGVLKKAVLQNGKVVEADIAVAGVGVVPATDFLKGSGLNMDRGFVKVDKNLQTNIPNIYAAGDITLFPLKINNDENANIQHWQMALYHGKVAGCNMANKSMEVDSVPFFWSVQYGKSLRYTGYGMKYDTVKIKGSIEEGKFCAYYINKNKNVVAVATFMADPIAANFASQLKAGKVILSTDI